MTVLTGDDMSVIAAPTFIVEYIPQAYCGSVFKGDRGLPFSNALSPHDFEF